jgi:serine/threonine protein kinase/tetratricopeptide (TPR) repeat protein
MADTPISELEARLAAASEPPVNAVERIDALNQIAWELRGRDVPRAHALASEARELAIAHDYPLGQARAARTMAMTVEDLRALERVMPLAEEAKRLFDQVDDGPGRAGSRDFLSSLHEFLGDLGTGLELALDALSIARQIGDPVREGYALSSVGGILAASGEVDAAVERLEEALRLFRSVDDAGGIGTITSRLARILKDAGRHDEALKYARMCRETAEKTDSVYLSWATSNVMAAIEAERGNHREAERLYRAALDSFDDTSGRVIVGAESSVALSRLLIARGALDEAEAELLLPLSHMDGNPMWSASAATLHEVVAELRELQGDLRASLDHLRKSQALREQVSRRDARAKLAQVEMRAAMEAARKDAEIHRLRFAELHGKRSSRGASGRPQFGNYELLERFAQGGMGEVWRARHRMLGRDAAIKLIRKDVLEDGHAESEVMLRRFEREARATSTLKSQHTVQIHDFGITEDGTFYYVMELLDGIGLDTLVERYGPQPAPRVGYILSQVCESLAEAHRSQLTHRDIKPGNILLCRYGLKRDFAKVVDFGLVKGSSALGGDVGVTHAAAVVGTPAFMPPEVAESSGALDARSDLYALGCVGYWLLTGTLVFEARTPMGMVLAHVRKPVEPPSSRSELPIPPDLERVIMACLSKDPAHRPQSAEALASMLSECSFEAPWSDERAAEWWNVHSPTTLANTSQRATLPERPVSATHEARRARSRRVWIGVAVAAIVTAAAWAIAATM